MPGKRKDVLLEEFDSDAMHAAYQDTSEAWQGALRTGAGALRTAKSMDKRLGTHFATDRGFRRKLEAVRQKVRENAGR